MEKFTKRSKGQEEISSDELEKIKRINNRKEKLNFVRKVRLLKEGGEGSGNYGHSGRPGEVGGSGEGEAGKTNGKEIKVGSPLYKEHEKLYQTAGRFVKSRIKSLFDLEINTVHFYTHESVPEDIKKFAIKTRGFGSIHPPAYVRSGPEGFDVVIDITKYKSAESLIDIIGHELGHPLASHFQEKKLLGNKLSYTKRYGHLIIHDATPSTENIADMFSHYLSGISLDAKEKNLLKRIGTKVEQTGFKEFLLQEQKLEIEKIYKIRVIIEGGEGSGNYGHAGRPGEVGGSGEGGDKIGGSNEERIKRSADILATKGVKVMMINTSGGELGATLAGGMKAPIDPETAENMIRAMEKINHTPVSVLANVKKVILYERGADLGSIITAGGQSWNRAGDYDFESGTLRAKVYPDNEVLLHELAHAEFYTLQQAAIRGIGQVIKKVDNNLEKLNQELNAGDDTIRNPSTPEQRAYNLFVSQMSKTSDTIGYVNDYAKAWRKEPIVQKGKVWSLVRADGSSFTYTFCSAHVSENENYAEISKMIQARFAFPGGKKQLLKALKLWWDSKSVLNSLRSGGI